ncbi:MAG TPA: hypothetical protein VHD84_01485, partial [Candidatus Saccharimonadales bacterium]|nr:hypothetical protein [Candidatus Saccharimonadales bacterium]
VIIGTGSTGESTAKILVLDNGSSSSDPTGVTGAMYYNASLGEFRCYGVDGISGWSNCNDPPSMRYRVQLDDDFTSMFCSSTTACTYGSLGWVGCDTATNQTITNVGSGSRPGVLQMTTSTSPTGQGCITMTGSTPSSGDPNDTITLTPGMTIELDAQLPTLSAGAQTYIASMGLTDITTDGDSNFALIAYNPSSSSNWQCQTDNGSTTTNTSSTAVDTNWHDYKIVVNSTTSVSFYEDGSLLCTNTTHVPTAALVPVMTIIKSGGTGNTTPRTMNIDYWSMRYDLSSPR